VRVRPINSLMSSFMFASCTFNTNDGESIVLNEVYKINQVEDQYDYKKSGAFFLWDTATNGYMYLVDSSTISCFGYKHEFGTLNYHFTETEDGYYVGLCFYVGRYFSSNTWKLNKNLSKEYQKMLSRYCLKKAFTIPANCTISSRNLEHSWLNESTQMLVDTSLSDLWISYVPSLKLQESLGACYLDSKYQPKLHYYTVFTLPELISYQSSLEELTNHTNYLDVVNYKVLFSYPYKIELVDNGYVNVELFTDWVNYPQLFIKWFTGIPIYRRETIVEPTFYLPTANMFVGGGLIGLLTGMAIDDVVLSTITLLNTTYRTYASSHCNIYMSPCTNFTDFVVTDVVSNFYFIAPGLSLYIGTFEPNIGYFILKLRNIDVNTRHSVDVNQLGRWYVSYFPIDNVQQQFPDEYLTIDFPVYTKIMFDVKVDNYEHIEGKAWWYPKSKFVLKPIVGIIPVIIEWNVESFQDDLLTDHYGNVSINQITMSTTTSSTDSTQQPDLHEWSKYNPNKWFVGKLETLTYTNSSLLNDNTLSCLIGNEISPKGTANIMIVDNVDSEFVIPLGVSVDRPIVESILQSIVADINSVISQYVSQNKIPPLRYVGGIESNSTNDNLPSDGNSNTHKSLTCEFNFLVLLNDGNITLSPETVKSKDVVGEPIDFTIDGLHHPLWWYVGSIYQPGKFVLGNKLILYYTPGSNLPKLSTYRILSHNPSNYMIKVYHGTMNITYDIEFPNMNGYRLIGAKVGISGVPILGLYESDTNKQIL